MVPVEITGSFSVVLVLLYVVMPVAPGNAVLSNTTFMRYTVGCSVASRSTGSGSLSGAGSGSLVIALRVIF